MLPPIPTYIPLIERRPPNPLAGLPFLLGISISESCPNKLFLKEFAIAFFRRDINQFLEQLTREDCPQQLLEDLKSKMIVDRQHDLQYEYRKLCDQFVQTISEIDNADLLRRIGKIESSVLPIPELMEHVRAMPARRVRYNPGLPPISE